MFDTSDAFFASAKDSITYFDTFVSQYDIPATSDHICYKCSSSDEFEHLRALLEQNSQYMFQSIISERRIAIVKFSEALESALGPIWFLELSDQKPNGEQTSGFDHIEVYPHSLSDAQALAKHIETSTDLRFKKKVRPHHTTFDLPISDSFKLRLEDEALIEKISVEEL